MTWFSVTPFIILAIVLLPFIVYLVYHRIKDVRVAKDEVHSKIDQILESTLTHDAYLRASDSQSKQVLEEIRGSTTSISDKLMSVIDRLINGKKHD